MYEDQLAITYIWKKSFEQLKISIDSHKDSFLARISLTSKIKNDTHIELNRKEAEILRDWLNNFLEDKDINQKFKRDLEKNE